ncbi:hypothetical protein [Acidianus sp. RZ1]|uniref:hypothetical protein n=1 Tax=Acidianus sp. RZ1 TaxID=1540082 RepID=UPI00149274E4|nr:hypothetical protein [Acidianus sp. RZ1]NON63152.1 hypothetical protein [Acidianus sp. RZ1]
MFPNINKEAIFKSWIPPEVIPNVVEELRKKGFKDAVPSMPQGEVYSLSKKLNEVWELHIRIFDNGFIESYIEVGREFFEHLGDIRAYVAYEAFEYCRDAYEKFHLYNSPANEWITEIYSNFRLELPPPSSLTPWKSIIGGLAILGIVTGLTYFLAKGGKE